MQDIFLSESLDLSPQQPPTNGVHRYWPRKKWLIIHPKNTSKLLVDLSGKVSMPLNLLMVATLAQKYFDVDFLDERIGDQVPEDFSGYDVVALTARTLNVKNAYAIADRVLAQGKKVILGGVHPTMLIDEAREHCTSVVAGEIESVWEELVHDIYHDTMKPVYRATKLKPLARMEHADFDIVRKSQNYQKYSFRIPLIGTKGCPVGCTFCCTPKIYGRTHRIRTPLHVIEEIQYHQRRLGKRDVHFSFMDDNICAQPAFVEELLHRMIGLGIKWNANISMNFLDKPHVPELSKLSGCELLNIGFESLTPETIKSVHKGSNRIEKYDLVVDNVHRQGIGIQGYFIFGFDTDTPASFQATYDFIMRNRIEFPAFTIATPFPGTGWYDEMKSRIQHFDWDKYDVYHSLYRPAKMDQEEFLRNFIKIQREVYSWRGIYRRMAGRRPDWIWSVNVAMHYFTRSLTPEMLV
jgi:bacteriochlorophyll C12 methyltransferase